MVKGNYLTQPLMSRRDYGSTDNNEKDALKTEPEDYDNIKVKKANIKTVIEDYDNYKCRGDCFLCDR
jgi:hypothetical protein